MSALSACPATSTSPIDIDPAKITGKCDLKCRLSHSYPVSTDSTAINHGDCVCLSYSAASTPPVTYNTTVYTVKEVRIYAPSLHTFSGQRTDAEVVIIHTNDKGLQPLYVCVPVTAVALTSSSSAGAFATIVDTVAKSAPTEGLSTTVPSFSLADIVPLNPFYTYTGTMPFQPCDPQTNAFVVFSHTNAADMRTDTYTTLTSVIAKHAYDIKPLKQLFFNSKGVQKSAYGASNDNIYIDCQPVGESEETSDVTVSSRPPITFAELSKSPLAIFLFSAAVFMILLWVIYIAKNAIIRYGA